MMDLSGRYWIDGMDIWTAFGLFVESGSDGFLNYPTRKDGISHDWLDSNGIDVDTSLNFLGPRDITLNFALLCSSESDYWVKYENFISRMIQPGMRRIQLAQFVGRSYQVYYKSCQNYHRFTKIIDADDLHKIASKFSVTFTETNPAPNSSDTFIVTEEGHFLIT
jgi:hypothetical protein